MISSEAPATNVYPPHGDIENQHPVLPDDWKQPGLKENGSESGDVRLRDAVTAVRTQSTLILSCKLICPAISYQGLVLVVCAAFLTTTPPAQAIDYTRTRCYI
jgi:hypothetical protein